MVIDDAIFVLFRRTRPELAIKRWLESRNPECTNYNEPFCLAPDRTQFITALQNKFPHYSADESEYIFRYIHNMELENIGSFKSLGVFSLIPKSVENYLTVDFRNECLCKHKSLLRFRELSHPIDPIIFVSAFLAVHDINNSYSRNIFSWPPIVRSDDVRLHHMLDHGMAENHFHIGGSSDAFVFSWICLMNHFTSERRKEFSKAQMDQNPLDTVFIGTSSSESCFSLTFKAACIRYFLFQRLNERWTLTLDSQYDCNDDPKTIKAVNDEWLMDMLSLTDDECDLYADEVNTMFDSMRELCVPADESNFIPDYAMYDEPFAPMDDNDLSYRFSSAVRNYERRLYRPLAGEQRFLYSLFKAILKHDPMIMPYLDVAYAYLLIYCQIRGELTQINERVGFANFLQYQNRKEIFTDNYTEYGEMRSSIAMQSVLLNPQVVSFEGRFSPSTTGEETANKIGKLISLSKHARGLQNTKTADAEVSPKLSFVIHFIKRSQWTSKNEEFELLYPRDHLIRSKNEVGANAIIEAMGNHPELLKYIVGIDAASDEINCRPEVFAPYFRKIKYYRRCNETGYSYDDAPAAVPRITYHAGEDFLDPIDGLRAISEAVDFCEMKSGDRIGHALALGIDIEDWYSFKQHTVLLRKQDHLDNMAWLYEKMNQYGCFNNGAEDYILRQFRNIFTDIYLSSSMTLPKLSKMHSVDIMNYYLSLVLRGNDPMLYIDNPETSDTAMRNISSALKSGENWKVHTNINDPISMALFHYYHFNHEMKLKGDEPISVQIPKEIIRLACSIQEKMQYEIAQNGICIECNPSSNYLIGTFKDYTKHPIFKFNNKLLYPPTHPNYGIKNPYICASINTDDLGIFSTSLENEYALMACALENYNDYCQDNMTIPLDNIYRWLDLIRQNGCDQSFLHTP